MHSTSTVSSVTRHQEVLVDISAWLDAIVDSIILLIPKCTWRLFEINIRINSLNDTYYTKELGASLFYADCFQCRPSYCMTCCEKNYIRFYKRSFRKLIIHTDLQCSMYTLLAEEVMESNIDTVLVGTWAANRTQWHCRTFTGKNIHVNKDKVTWNGIKYVALLT